MPSFPPAYYAYIALTDRCRSNEHRKRWKLTSFRCTTGCGKQGVEGNGKVEKGCAHTPDDTKQNLRRPTKSAAASDMVRERATPRDTTGTFDGKGGLLRRHAERSAPVPVWCPATLQARMWTLVSENSCLAGQKPSSSMVSQLEARAREKGSPDAETLGIYQRE